MVRICFPILSQKPCEEHAARRSVSATWSDSNAWSILIRRGDEERRKVFEAQFQKLTWLPLTSPIFDLAAELRALHRVKTPDALHAAAAILHSCDEFWTNDRRLAALEPRIALRVLPETTP